MSFLHLPLTTDTDAPLPSGVGYDVSQEQHAGCPRGGWLAVEIEPMTGASVECCTACRHRRTIGRYALRVADAAPPEPERKPMGMNRKGIVRRKAA